MRHVDEIMKTIVKDKYLTLHRENYLDLYRDTDMRLIVKTWIDNFTIDEVYGLLSDRDWRPRVVGIHCLALMQYDWVPHRLSAELGNCTRPLTARPLCLAMAIVGGDIVIDALHRFLELPYKKDDVSQYAAALGALKHLKDKSYVRFHGLILKELMQESFYEKGMLEESERRLHRAIRYWK